MMLQRVIRTELYDEDDYGGAKPDISFAWIKAPVSGKISNNEIEGLRFNVVPLTRTSSIATPSSDIFDNFLMTLLDPAQIQLYLPPSILYNPPPAVVSGWAAEVRSTEVVVERSPPAAFPFSALLHQSTAMGVGTLIGGYAADGHSLLLFITVPAGVILVGTAKGISSGLEKGLSKRIEKWLNPTQARGRRSRDTSGNGGAEA